MNDQHQSDESLEILDALEIGVMLMDLSGFAEHASSGFDAD